MSKLFKILTLIVLVLGLSTSVYAQNASPSPASQPVHEVKDLTFPIPDLGNCGDYKSCLTYCDDPVNNAQCIDFAKKHGFYKDDPVLASTDKFLTKAKDVLGCDSKETCLTLCSDPANFDKCDAFAKSQGVLGGYVEEPDKKEFLDKAKTDLGCDSAESCSNFCENSANADKCDKFSDDAGLLGGEVSVGPGGCNTNGTCQSFCSDPANFSECTTFAPPGGNFTGPGGCSSPQECRNHCEENPADCRSYAPGSNGVYVPVSCPSGQFFGPSGICTANEKTQEAGSCAQGGKFWNGSSCQDQAPPGIHSTVGGAYFQPRPEMGNCSTPGSCYDYCKENPGKCAGFSANAERPKDDYIPSLYYTPGTDVKFAPKAEMGNCDSPGGCYDYCKENPGKCQGFDSKAPRPVDTYVPGTYYTPPSNYTYFTPPATNFYVTPMYYTPPAGSNYTTPSYYTPGMYSTPSYYTPTAGSNYTTPTYYTPGSYYSTPSGQYPTPSYSTPIYYTPLGGSNYTTPTYYSPPTYITPNYFTPSDGRYTTPTYNTPPQYTTPKYYTPYTGGQYTTPVYYTPPEGSNYTTPTYYSPTSGYPSPTYYSYPTPGGSYSYPSPSYYSYPTPGSYSYPTPSGGYSYPSPGYSYPSPGGYTYPSPSYGSPSYGSPSYGSPSYGTPDSYSSPSYGSPYGSPSYGTPGTYATPGSVAGVSSKKSILDIILSFFSGQ